MATTATTIVEAASTSSGFMLPGMESPEDTSRVVRFDNECVLIPEVSRKRSMVLTKSYSLPLWKKRGSQMSDSEAEDAGAVRSQGARSPSPEDSRVVLRVPIPTFRRRSSRSPTRGRSASASPVVPTKLPSCLVHRAPSSSPTITRRMPLSPVRRPSLPPNHIDAHHQRRKDEMTVPLRDCCHECERITEEPLKEGDTWQEKFSRAAKRRRSTSLDYQDMVRSGMLPPRSPTSLSSSPPSDFASLPDPLAVHRRAVSFNKEFSILSIGGTSALSAQDDALNLNEPESPTVPRFGSSAGRFALTVDEVDKRRKSLDLGKEKEVAEHLQARGLLSPPSPSSPSFAPTTVFHSPSSPYSGSPCHPNAGRHRPHDRDISSSPTASTTSSFSSASVSAYASNDQDKDDVLPPLPDILDPRRRLRSSGPGPARSSPIDEEEEDEAQLFPLPRRSPSGSRSGTPSPRPSPRVSPVPTPNGSAVELSGSGGAGGKGKGKDSKSSAAAAGSKDSLLVERGSVSNSSSTLNSSQESLLKASLSRKTSASAIGTSHAVVSTASTPTNTPKGKTSTSSGSTVSTSSSGSISNSNSNPTTPSATSQAADRSTSPTPTKKRLSVSTTSSSTSSSSNSNSNPPMSPKGPRPSSKALAAQLVKERATIIETGSGRMEVQDKEVVVVTATATPLFGLSSLAPTAPSSSSAPSPSPFPSSSPSSTPSKPLAPLRPGIVTSESSSSGSVSSSTTTTSTTTSVSPVPHHQHAGHAGSPLLHAQTAFQNILSTAHSPFHLHGHHSSHSDKDASTQSHTPSPAHTTSAPIPIPSNSGSGSHPTHTHTHAHTTTQFPSTTPTSPSSGSHTHAHTHSNGHGHTPTSPSQKRKLSFTAPFLRAGEALREVGADVLKGVSSISGTGPGVVG
ncbi:unnamed protein product [Cyclocybe aegerita]|uniref:Uncharacterized protein n=1 Tax=Cyclocybe aegerita TaxID=1973307 RepID=A0A8S0VSU0_CYCAE|nr:unnamed protein product [Cyclocybe aegerita]